jgi:AraC-like DNA-binding protein
VDVKKGQGEMNVSYYRKLALAKFPRLIRDALGDFRRLTGFTAVTALRSAPVEREARALVPPVHPRCATLLRHATRPPPCDAEWRKHLDAGLSTSSGLRHTCPLGLRCACVPVLLGGELLGLAKFVSGPEISKERFRSAVDLLDLLVARPCQEMHNFFLREEIKSLHTLVNRLQRAKQPASVARRGPAPPAKSQPAPHLFDSHSRVIGEVLDYLGAHFTEPELCLTQVAAAVGKNKKYLAHLFAHQVGERMRAYITTLRVGRACELLLETRQKITQVARQAGFTNAVQFRQAFRLAMGVTATEYQQIFGGRS